MTLVVPRVPRVNFAATNLAANPSATPGTNVTPGTSGAEGTFTELISDASITDDCSGIWLGVMQNSAPTAPRNCFMDIALDLAGGTTYATPLIDNIVIGSAPAMAAGSTQFFFPVMIPSGAAVAARMRGVSGTPGSYNVSAYVFGRNMYSAMRPRGQIVTTYGISETTAVDATAFTPGNAADGNWASLGATSRDAWWWQLGYQIDNATITAEFTYIDLGYGDGTAGGTTTIMRILHTGNASEYVIPVLMPGNGFSPWCYCPLPSGTTLYARGRCNGAPDTGYQAAAYGVS